MINAQKPDLILIGGDLIDNSVVPLYAEKMMEELTELKAPLGIYMVPGNHEYISGIRKSMLFIKETPIHLLRDEVVTLPGGIQIIGRDDRSNKSRLSLQELVKNIDPAKPVILLDHQPYNLSDTENAGIDLQFSGHTHRGQVWPISLITDHLFDQRLRLPQVGKQPHIRFLRPVALGAAFQDRNRQRTCRIQHYL